MLACVEAQISGARATARSTSRQRIRTVRAGATIDPTARWLWLAVLAFVAVSVWWMTQDNRIPIWDAGNHMHIAFDDGVALSHGRFWIPFEVYTTYPPLVHLVGAVSYLLVGMHPIAMMLAANFVFVPLLAFGCYGTGTILAGRRAGLLAGVFALGMPMVASMFHSFMVDTPQAAMVAVSVWAILASRRFERVGVAAGAGALCGLAMLTKQTSVLFLAGILVAAFVRGGWRHWRGLAAFAVALAVVAGPWYVYHWSQMTQTFTSIGQLYVDPLQSPPRWSLASLGWYFWDLINEQAGLVLTVAFVIGTVVGLVRMVGDRLSRDSVLPELVAGGLVAYLGVTYLTHKDPRYDLPALVYIAVMGTFWLPAIRRRPWRLAATSLVLGFAVINFAGMSLGIGGTRRLAISLPGSQNNFLYTWKFTVYQDEGWLRGGPEHDADVPKFVRGLAQLGITEVGVDPVSANVPDFSMLGITPYGDVHGMSVGFASAQTQDSVFLMLHRPGPGDPPACQVMSGGMGIYAVRGPSAGIVATSLRNPADPSQAHLFVCPGRPAESWPAAHA